MSRTVLEPEILAERARWQIPPRIGWAAGVDLDYDVPKSDTFEDTAHVELVPHHPQAHVPNAAPATLRRHDASH
jgi:hypothetical protein